MMRCTKCSGTGSEGFITFLRCGRCSGTGDEPKDALVPYSPELIVVPSGPVITALKEGPEAVEKKLTSQKKRQEKPDLGPDYSIPPPSPYPSSHAPYSYGASQGCVESNRVFDNSSPEEEKPRVRPISQFFDITPGCPEPLIFGFKHLSRDLYNQEVFLHEIGFDSKNKYMIKAYHQGYMFLEAFYTGLGVKAVMDEPCRIYPIQDIRFDLDPQDKNPDLPTDRMALTVWIEEREAQMVQMYPMNRGYGPTYSRGYGQR